MPTMRVTVQEAQDDLERLLNTAEKGQQVIITRPGRPSIYLKREKASEPSD